MTIEQYIKSLYSNEYALKNYLRTIVESHTVLNVPVPQCFYIQDFVNYYERFKEEIETICKEYDYTDKRKNDIMKQRKVQFVYWCECQRLLEVLE